jgi:L-aspartate oxidase
MPLHHEAGDLAPRDVVTRTIANELQRTGSDFVYLDLTGLDADHIRHRFPHIYATCLAHNLDIAEDLIPVRPAAHYSVGGVATDLEGRMSLPGLYAAGEVACNGVHGANRLAGNSLLEGLVFGARAGGAMIRDCPAEKPPRDGRPASTHRRSQAAEPSPSVIPAEVAKQMEAIRHTLWRNVGIIRSAGWLQKAFKTLASLAAPMPASPLRAHYELENIRLVGEVISRCALAREESRGTHYRSDYPLQLDDQWKKHSQLAVGDDVRFA